MVLEATIIVVDNSESARNGDYLPSRFQAQTEAVSLIFNAKTSSNPESAVGLLSMAGTGPTVLNTPTANFGAILAGLHETKIKGQIKLGTAISVAMLALKHRANKSQRQRVVVLICSELDQKFGDKNDTEKELIKLAKKCRKSNVSVDFVAFGDAQESKTREILEKFVENAGGAAGEGNHLAVIPPGTGLLSDSLITTPIVSMGDVGGAGGMEGIETGGGSGAGGNGFEYGIDPATDPELAMALRMSMEEEQNRLERERRAREEQERQNGGGDRMDTITEEGQQQNGEGDKKEDDDSKQPRVEDGKDD